MPHGKHAHDVGELLRPKLIDKLKLDTVDLQRPKCSKTENDDQHVPLPGLDNPLTLGLL